MSKLACLLYKVELGYLEIKRLPKKLSRALSYFKQGYSSEDWSYDYLLEDIAFKLHRMQDNNINCNYSHPSEIKKLDKIYTDLLTMLYIQKTQAYRDQCDVMIESIDLVTVDEPNEDGNYEGWIKRVLKPGFTEEQYQQAIADGHIRQEKNLKDFFKLLSRKIKHLWI